MHVWILSICPGIFEGYLSSPLVERGRCRGNFLLDIVDLRDFVEGCFRKVDDSPYGGGAGMILRCEPVYNALESLRQGAENLYVISLTPGGKPYGQRDALRLAQKENLALICGHYEGMDERISQMVDEEISLGDFILSGGEIPAMAVADSLSRLMDGALKEGSLTTESFDGDRLEYPQYTRPQEFMGLRVPGVLLSGNHGLIEKYRAREALLRTLHRRPDMIERTPLTEEERRLIEEGSEG